MKTLIGIVVPSGDMIHADTAWSIATSCVMLTFANLQFTIINPKCSLVQKGRYIGVKQALDAGCSHVMFIDSDMVFPQTAILELFQHQKEIVGCYYPKRQEGGQIVGTDNHFNKPFNRAHSGLQKARTLGTGMMLIDTSVFKRIPEPWFHVEFIDGVFTSEDEYFCLNNLTDVWCDCDLSKQVGHIGSITHRSK